jgi:hypothetical protein
MYPAPAAEDPLFEDLSGSEMLSPNDRELCMTRWPSETSVTLLANAPMGYDRDRYHL